MFNDISDITWEYIQSRTSKTIGLDEHMVAKDTVRLNVEWVSINIDLISSSLHVCWTHSLYVVF